MARPSNGQLRSRWALSAAFLILIVMLALMVRQFGPNHRIVTAFPLTLFG